MQTAQTLPDTAIAKKSSRFRFGRLFVLLASLTLIFLYLLLAPAISSEFYNANLLFMPVKYDKFSKWWHDREAQEVFFTNKKGNRLQGIYLPSEKNDRVVLMHHGQYGNTAFHLTNHKFLLQPQDGLFIYDYEGFGKSEGSPTIEGMADDARAAYHCLVTKFKIDPKTIVHYGVSLGTGPATLIASEKPCGGLILFSPYTSLKDASRSVHPFLNMYPDFLLTSYDFDTVANVKRLKAPLFIVHGVEDTAIPVRQADQIFKAAHEPKTFHRLEGQGHGLYLSDELLTDLHRFVRNLR